MRHPCEPSEYQFHYDRRYLRTPTNPQTDNNQSPTNEKTAQTVRYPVPNRDLDILFEVKKSRKPGECVASVQYDTHTGEVLSIKPLSTSNSPPSNFPNRGGRSGEEITEKESLATQLTLNSFTRHGYNVEHLRGAISGPLPGMVSKEARTGKHRHDPTRTTVQDHFGNQ